MNNKPSQNDQNDHIFTKPNNLQPTAPDVIQLEQGYLTNIAANSDFPMNDDNIFPTSQTNNNYFVHQLTSNENITSTSISSPYVQQYDHPQPIENTSSSFGSFNMTTINPSQSEIFSFDIPGYKIIIIPTFPQQDNTYSNYSSLGTTDNQFTQFRQ
ncbi:uncharacterized protein OCT59_013392 [Rhizophagus irregularis]|uniref:Uncharacterized protein n=3 Tax=Rhizophagus irregularis TaxID=588596 RepID=U9T8W6_RHIID|nr:hypothetical protein GLOIN_2v1822239 [Rhizophagus irregularis DAOM 181602=DAOM 197198]EXX57979.1 hypothetical protein RirG_202110 [Rhizophagus irregularis DAOM 197198w]UZO20983.1 hypothetical protein OCT59_013392 [Rhizophagus irregularis]POG75881.1 hypothetical protein GLOIN_2v1822239 [Rhizophagus irregularis DAOM 181602=DAOM 197198]CAG8671937.1 7396_t:CDS:1 [Rhizophagus irregularis]GBC27515.1 hypothetical protein GLOIN_2v1822239 [Rhizophagus irregularis DAOM 181602=DAOM 197198]|eukprot:XP_025182747.1 hypothetical protein GLOIN_2v1822239 [Rhizophagus irregularis DAOM 181602=DAOM 197198]